MNQRLVVCALLAGCAAVKPPAYSERCNDPGAMCTFSYDFEPSGVARNVFAPPDGKDRFLVVNEDALIFSWSLAPEMAWDHDHVEFARSLGGVVNKVESAASAVCDGVPVLLVAANFMPGRTGREPERERIVALVGSLDASPRVLEQASRIVQEISVLEGAKAPKVEGLALSTDCRTLYVGLRSVLLASGADALREEVFPITLDVDWRGTREEATLGKALVLETALTCSGKDEGISSLEVLADGTLLATTSYENELVAKQAPTDIAQGDLYGSLWRQSPNGTVERLACFPGHKPEALAVNEDGTVARVIAEDDEYAGRPIQAFAVKIPLKK